MKIRNLVITLCIILLQAPMSSYAGNNNQSAEKISVVVVEDTLVQKNDSKAQTADNFDTFVKEIIENSPSKNPDSLTCTEFKSSIELLAFMLTQFDNNDVDKKEFGRTDKYESDYLKLEYADKDVKDGFAQLNMTFKKKKQTPTYKILFKHPAK